MALPSAGPTDCSSGLSNRIFNNLRYDNPWQALQGGVQVGTLCCPTVPGGIGFKCTAITTGITGSGEPSWPGILGNTVVDGGVTWTAQDVANPTGKAHTPTGQFGYLGTSSDLDGFRLLAYDIAKGACDEIVADACSVIAYRAAALSIATAAFTPIPFDTVDVNTNSAYNTGTGVFTAPNAGRYIVASTLGTNPGAAAGILAASVYKDSGAGFAQIRLGQALQLYNPVAYGYEAALVYGEILLAAGDKLEIQGFQSTGAPLALAVGAQGTFMSIERVLGS